MDACTASYVSQSKSNLRGQEGLFEDKQYLLKDARILLKALQPELNAEAMRQLPAKPYLCAPAAGLGSGGICEIISETCA